MPAVSTMSSVPASSTIPANTASISAGVSARTTNFSAGASDIPTSAAIPLSAGQSFCTRLRLHTQLWLYTRSGLYTRRLHMSARDPLLLQCVSPAAHHAPVQMQAYMPPF